MKPIKLRDVGIRSEAEKGAKCAFDTCGAPAARGSAYCVQHGIEMSRARARSAHTQGEHDYRKMLDPHTLKRLQAYERGEPMPPYPDGRTAPPSFDCPVCKMPFATQDALAAHIARRHKDVKR